MPRNFAARIQLADHEPGVYSMIIFAHCHAAAVSHRLGCPAGSWSNKLQLTGLTYQVTSAHCRFSAVASRR